MMKEAYGRRRETALRVKLLGREEKMLEGLRRWLRKGEEAVSNTDNEAKDTQSRVWTVLLGMTQDARILLESLDDGVVTDSVSLSGSLARVVLAQELADGLVEELKMETARRIDLEKAILQEEQNISRPIPVLNGSDFDQRPPESDEQDSSPNNSSLAHLEVVTVHPPQPDEAQTSIPILVDSTSPDSTALDISSPTTKDGLIPLDSADDTVTAANEHSPIPFHPLQSDNLTPNQVSVAVFSESTAAEPLSVDLHSNLPSSIPIPDIVVDVDVTQPPHICAETLLEEETDIGFQNSDLVETSSVPVVVEPEPQAELVQVDNSTSLTLPLSPSEPYSVVDPAVTLSSVDSLPTSTGQSPVLAEQEPKISTPHPLIAELAKISHRYDDFQRSFRDCHLALEGLKVSLGPSSSTTSLNHQSNRPVGAKPPELTLTPIIPIDVLHAAVSRLDDYTEDVRVEVEIRISDEEVLAKGYEVLLCVPGALCSSSARSLLSPSLQADQHQLYHHQSQHLSQPPISSHYGEDQDLDFRASSSLPPTQSELEFQIQAFITGTDPSVTKVCEGFSKKLEDVQHDIALLKRAIHDPDPEMTMGGSQLSSQTPTMPDTGGRGWASWIRSPSGPTFSTAAAPAKHIGSPTFGSIMTSPHRLKHSPSLNLGNQRSTISSSATLVNGNESSWMQGAVRGGKDDILGRLGLRVPMPIFDSTVHQPSSSSTSMGGLGWNGLSPTMTTPIKQRSVSSTMYMLGLGASPMMVARSRGITNNSSLGLQNSDDTTVAVDTHGGICQ